MATSAMVAIEPVADELVAKIAESIASIKVDDGMHRRPSAGASRGSPT